MRRVIRKRFLPAIAAVILIGLSLGGIVLASLFRDLPDPKKFDERKVVESTKIYDRTGQVLLFEIHGEEKRTVIPFEKIPKAVKNATIALEDSNFYRHGGIDFKGVARAFLVDLSSGNFQQGGSTITQQLVKNSILSRERTVKRKVKEALLAILLESRYSKDEILNLYLNQIPYGSNAYGIEAASQTYFGTSTPHLTLAQSALLAGLPKAPTYYSPYGSHADELTARKDLALDRMAELGYINRAESDTAKKEKLKFLPHNRSGISAPHFVMYVRELLIKKYGEEIVREGGLTVRTTLDWRLQEEAEKIVKEGAEFNEKAIKAKNAALVAVNPKNGEILAMVGSRDYFDVENEGNFNVATALRQPGSAFKPFVYYTAFKKGYTPETVLFDVPTEFNPLCSTEGKPDSPLVKKEDCYHPGNYDEKFRGPVTLRQALGQSLNVPSAKVLYLAGVEDSIQNAEAMGITTLKDRSRFGLSLVLGGAEVQLLEMASAYGVFATEGIRHPHRAILSIESGGRVSEEPGDEGTQVIDTEIARVINDVLSDDEARLPIFQPQGSLWLPDRPAAAKTGTTQEFRDAWTIGYTPSLVVGVWAGNNDNTPMQQKGSGVLAAAPLWNKFMRFAARDTLPEFFNRPDYKKSDKPVLNGLWHGENIVRIDKVSGKLATDLTPDDLVEEAAFGEPHDPLFWINKNDPAGPPPADPIRDSQFKNWETAFKDWLKTSGFVSRPISQAPKEYDDVHTKETEPRINVSSMADAGDHYRFAFSVESRYPLKEVNVLVQDALVASALPGADGRVSFKIKKAVLGDPPSNVVLKAYDRVGNRSEFVIPFEK